MAALNFPSNPSNGQTFVAGSITYTFDGQKWIAGISSGATGATGPTGPAGNQGSTGIVGGIVHQVTNAGAGSYTIDVQTNPTLHLIRGFTYYFNVNAPGHPFWIKTSQVTGTTDAYILGITNNGIENGTVVFTVPFDAPSTLYYICQYHGSMTGVFNVSNFGPTGATGATGAGATGATGPTVSLTGITSNVVPAQDSVYDLGSPSLRWRDLYLSGNSFYIGSSKISSAGSTITIADATSGVAANVAVNQITLGTGGNAVVLKSEGSGLITLQGGNAVPLSGGGASVTVSNTAPSSPSVGNMWFDTETGRLLLWYNDGLNSVWIAPIGGVGSGGSGGGSGSSAGITTVTYPGAALAASTTGGETITVAGSGFAAGAKVFVDMTECTASVTSTTSLSFTTPAKTSGTYHLYVYNTDGSHAMKPAGIVFSALPVWQTNAGALTSAIKFSAYSANVVATGDQPITYDLISGAVPAGITFSSNGAIAGTITANSAVYSFTVLATDAQNQTASRSFSITVSDLYSFEYLIVGGGGSSGQTLGGGGGAGGFITGNVDNIGSGINYPVVVGGGGATNSGGTASSFNNQTAAGGGFGGSTTGYHPSGPGSTGGNGGSAGGGAGCDNAAGPCGPGGTGNTPSLTPSQGTNGGNGSGGSSYNGAGGGGGGAAVAGNNAPSGQQGGAGGAGKEWPAGSGTYYAGGGGGNSRYDRGSGNASGGIGGGGANNSTTGNAGAANTGGGAGAGNSGSTASGGSGIVIIRYTGNARATGGTITSSDGYTYHTFTTSGTYVS